MKKTYSVIYVGDVGRYAVVDQDGERYCYGSRSECEYYAKQFSRREEEG